MGMQPGNLKSALAVAGICGLIVLAAYPIVVVSEQGGVGQPPPSRLRVSVHTNPWCVLPAQASGSSCSALLFTSCRCP